MLSFITPSEFYDRDRSTYCRAIQSVRQRNLDLTGWLEYFALGLKGQLSELRDLGESLIRLHVLTKKYKLSARQPIALQLALGQGRFHIQDLETKCPGVHRRGSQCDLRGMIEQGVLIVEGATNQLVYRVAPNP